ncbi:putative WD-repeat protein [Xylaria scruposa]|nr:putative WD-repeat protein [Xylaria scruposa]
MEAGSQSTQQTPATTTTQQLSHEDYTVGWICALSTEHIAAVAFLDEKHGRPAIQDPNDDNSYTLGRYGDHNTVIAVLPSGEYGKSSAASVARDMLRSFPNIRIGLMVGIGGGAPSRNNDIRLGDVVVSIPSNGRGGVMQYDMGKDIQDKGFQISGYLDHPPRVLRTTVQDLRTEYTIDGHQLEQDIQGILQSKPRLRKKYDRPSDDSDRLYQSEVLHENNLCCESAANHDPSILVKRPQREVEDSLVIHYGLIASGDTLMKNAIVRDRLSEDESVLCFEMEAAGLMNHFPCLVIRGICDYSDTHKNKQWQDYAAMTATAYAKDLLKHMPSREVHNEQTIANHLRQLKQDVRAIDRKMVSIDEKLVKVNENTSNIDEKMGLNLLPIAYGATFDSHSEEYNQFCLPDTRVQLLQTISQWVDDQKREAVFWLNGMAGTGKSTISRTLSRSFSESRQLGASFFFKRGEADRSVATKFFTTIAAQLLRTKPAIAPYIKRVLDDDPSIVQKSLSEQFDRLILKPLSNLPDDSQQQKSLLIVVDALDECDMENDIRVLINLFSLAKSRAPRLRIFVTSRPELPPRMGFNDLSGKYEKFILHEICHSIIRKDMLTFLRHELSIRKAKYNNFVKDEARCLPSDWPQESNLEKLLDMTVPLFISAVTICRFLFDHHVSGGPARKLSVVLQKQAVSRGISASSGLLLNHPYESKMNAIYQPILTQMLRGMSVWEREAALTEFQIIVGSIVILASPLSASALARMLNIEEVVIHDRLDHLHSVLNVPNSTKEPIKLFHLSFREFLLDPEKCERSGPWINERETHRQLRKSCLRVMECSLRKDMCSLNWPGTTSPSSERVDRCLRPEVRYACQYWVHHTEQAGDFPQNDDEVYGFLRVHLLHWLEVMVLLGRIDEALMSVRSLRSRSQCPELNAFLDDALRVIRMSTHIISTTPLQIYYSALVFSPRESIVREVYRNDILKYLSSLPQTEPRWSACLHTLEGHQQPVTDIAFSHDGTLIATAHSDGTVKVASSNTGSYKQILQQSGQQVCSVTFSPDDTRLVMVSHYGDIELWFIDTGTLEQTEKTISSSNYCRPLAVFSPNGRYMVSCSNYEISFWSMNTGRLRRSGFLGRLKAKLIAFSVNSELIVIVSGKGLIKSFSAETWTPVKRIQLPIGRDIVLAISPDATSVATRNPYKDRIQVWSVDTGKLLQTLRGNWRTGDRCAFSLGSKLLATTDLDSPLTVNLWSIKTGGLQQTLECTSAYLSFIFSPDATLLASRHRNGKVKIWSVHQAMEGDNGKHSWPARTTKHNGEAKLFESLAFSPDNSFVISTNTPERDAILLWYATQGPTKHRLIKARHRISGRGIHISPGSQLVAINDDWRIDLWSRTTGSLLGSFEGYLVSFSPYSEDVAIASRHRIHFLPGTDLLRHERGGPFTSDLRPPVGSKDSTYFIELSQQSDPDRLPRLASITFSLKSQLAVTVLEDRSIQIWSISLRQRRFPDLWDPDRYLKRDQQFDSVVVLSPDSRLIAIRNQSDKELQLISTKNLQTERRLKGQGATTNAIAFSLDSSLVAVASDNGILLWSVNTDTCLQILYSCPVEVNRLSFDKTSQFLLSNIGTVRLPRELLLSTTITSTAQDSASARLPQRSISWQDCQKLWTGYGLSADRCWVTWNGKNLLWLPADFRPEAFNVSESGVAFGTESKRVVIIGFR